MTKLFVWVSFVYFNLIYFFIYQYYFHPDLLFSLRKTEWKYSEPGPSKIMLVLSDPLIGNQWKEGKGTFLFDH